MSTGVITREGTVVPPGQIVRYTFKERLCHWINALAYSYDMLTGLALFTPHLYWLAAVLGGGPTIRFWHPWIGLIFIVTIFWMHALWRGDMAHTERDREWTKNVKYYVQNSDEMMPAQDRFNAGVDDNLPVVDAEASLAGAQAQLVQALYQYNTAKLQLARNTGIVESQYRTYLGTN